MRDRVWWSVIGLGLLAGILVAVVVGQLDSTPALITFELIVVGITGALAVALAVPLRYARRDPPLPVERAHRPATLRPLGRLASLIAAAARHEGDAYYRLRPRLRGIVTGALARRHVDLDNEPWRARALLGDEAWQWLRPDRPPPADRHAPGPGLEHLGRIVDVIEQLEVDAR